jgi:hypothetical protein
MIDQLKQFTAITEAVEGQLRELLRKYEAQLDTQPNAQLQLSAEADFNVRNGFARSYRLVVWPSTEQHPLVPNPRPKIHLLNLGQKIFVYRTLVDSTNREVSRGGQEELALHDSNVPLLVHATMQLLTWLPDEQLAQLGVRIPNMPLNLS